MNRIGIDDLPTIYVVTEPPEYDKVTEAADDGTVLLVKVLAFGVLRRWHAKWEGAVNPMAAVEVCDVKLHAISDVIEGSDEAGFSFRCLMEASVKNRIDQGYVELTDNRPHEVIVLGSASQSAIKAHIIPRY